MKPPNWIAVWCAALAAVFAVVSIYFAIVFRFAVGVQGSPTFTVDEILAALTLMVALVGLIVAMAAIVIGIVAVFGFGEIRQIVSRRTDELLKKAIGTLRKRREITASEASELWQAVQDEALAEFEPEAATLTSDAANASPNDGGGEMNDQLDQYPSGERRDNE
jgi:hypothetical protein